MKHKSKTFAVLTIFVLFAVAALAGQESIKISAYDTMKYSVTKIVVHSGDKVTVTLTNEGNLPKQAMGHNWVLLQAGVDPNAYSRLAINAKDSDYQPKSLASRVIAAIPVLGPKESGSVTFTAPAPGTYPYLCSFPAHCGAGMNGILIVQ
jgi:azurin